MKKDKKIVALIFAAIGIILLSLGSYMAITNKEKNVENNLNETKDDLDIENTDEDDDTEISDDPDFDDEEQYDPLKNITNFGEFEEKEQLGNISINSDIIKNLIYPKVNSISSGSGSGKWEWIDSDYKSLGREMMMDSAAQKFILKNQMSNFSILATDLKENYTKIFGPDTEYKDGKIADDLACSRLGKYDEIKKEYPIMTQCGGLALEVRYEIRMYKANKTDNEIQTYFYVQPYIEGFESDTKIYLLDKITKAELTNWDKIIKDKKTVSSEEEIKEMVKNGEVATYMFTFKKQSDGNYYFQSGKWQ